MVTLYATQELSEINVLEQYSVEDRHVRVWSIPHDQEIIVAAVGLIGENNYAYQFGGQWYGIENVPNGWESSIINAFNRSRELAVQ